MSGRHPFLFTGAPAPDADASGFNGGWPFLSPTSADGLMSPDRGSFMQTLPGLGSFSSLPGLGDMPQVDGSFQSRSANDPPLSTAQKTTNHSSESVPSAQALPGSSLPAFGSSYTKPQSSQNEAQLASLAAAGLPPRPPSRHSPSDTSEEGEVSDGNHDRMVIDSDDKIQASLKGVEVQSKSSALASIPMMTNGTNTANSTGNIQVASAHNSEALASDYDLSRGTAVKSREDAKHWVCFMHEKGITYKHLVQEGLDTKLLRDIYMELGLRLEKSSNTLHNGANLGLPSGGVTLPSPYKSAMPSTVTKDAPTSTMSSAREHTPIAQTSAPSKDRKEYIARLMAAKSKFSSPSATAASATEPSSKSNPTTLATNTETSPAPTPTPVASDIAAEKKAKLARLRAQALETARERKMEKERLANVAAASTIAQKSSNPGDSQPQTVAPSLGTSNAINSTNPLISDKPTDWIANAGSMQRGRLSFSSAAPKPSITASGPAPTASSSSKPTFGQPSVLTRASSSRDSSGGVQTSSLVIKNKKRPSASPDSRNDAPSQKKRPFGQPRNAYPTDECIIEASDDEAGDVVDQVVSDQRPEKMDIDGTTGGEGTSGHSTSTAFSQPLASSDSTTLVPEDSGAATAHATSKSSSNQSLSLHERQILEMRKRIALIERKRSKPVTPVPLAPSLPLATQEPLLASDTVVTPLKEDDVVMTDDQPQSQNLVETNTSTLSPVMKEPRPQDTTPIGGHQQPQKPQQPGTNIVQSEKEPADEEMTSRRSSTMPNPSSSLAAGPDPTWRKKRRAEIEASLNERKTATQSAKSKMEQLRAQMLELEEAAQKEQEARDRLALELEELGIDTENIANEDLQQVRDDAVAELEAQADDEVDQSAVQNKDETSSTKLEAHPDTAAPSHAAIEDVPKAVPGEKTFEPEVGNEADMRIEKSAQHDPDPRTQPTLPTDPIEIESGSSSMEESSDSSRESSIAPRPAESEPQVSQTDSLAQDRNKGPQDRNTKPAESHADHAEFGAEGATGAVSSPAVAERDEISSQSEAMDLDDESYEPAEVTKPAADVSSVAEPSHSEMGVSSEEGEIAAPSVPDKSDTISANSSSDESEDYEPPDPSAIQLTSLFDDEDGDEQEDPYEPPEVFSADGAGTSDAIPTQSPVLRSTSEGAASEQAALNAVMEEVENHESGQPLDEETFKPYVSPLRIFRDWRYHPDFLNTIRNGYRSLTYSNSLNPTEPICRNLPHRREESCHDAECQLQHLSPRLIKWGVTLKQMQNDNPGATPKEKASFRKGLRERLDQLGGSSHPDRITQLIAYRRDFLKDPSRVLTLTNDQ